MFHASESIPITANYIRIMYCFFFVSLFLSSVKQMANESNAKWLPSCTSAEERKMWWKWKRKCVPLRFSMPTASAKPTTALSRRRCAEDDCALLFNYRMAYVYIFPPQRFSIFCINSFFVCVGVFFSSSSKHFLVVLSFHFELPHSPPNLANGIFRWKTMRTVE